jgi:peptidoglycan/LPS O-acetylase OafA/YrhL
LEIRKLNTLRGIAALMVAVSHYSLVANGGDNEVIKGNGQLGVMIFFILSGFLMSFLYLNKEFNRTSVKKYAIARFARVVPLFLCVVFASYFLHLAGIEGVLYKIPNISSLFAHLTLVYGSSILWTIPAEIQFYISFLFLWFIFDKRAVFLWVLISIIYISIVVSGYPTFIGGFFDSYYLFTLFRSLPYFLVGIIFGQLYINWSPPESLRSNAFILAFLLVILLYPDVYTFIFGYEHKMWKDMGVLAILSLSFFLIVFFVPDDSPLMCNRLGDFLGKTSYSIYLLHLPIAMALKSYAQNSPSIYFPVFISLVLLASYLSFSYIENPSRRIIRGAFLK